jgi:hypothetical protein
MPFITQGKTNWKFLLIVIILAIIVGGGALWWARSQYFPSNPDIIKKQITKQFDLEIGKKARVLYEDWGEFEISITNIDNELKEVEISSPSCLFSELSIQDNKIIKLNEEMHCFNTEECSVVFKLTNIEELKATFETWYGCAPPGPKGPFLPKEIIISIDETADWKTYRNEEYGFEIKYPKEWNNYPDWEARKGWSFVSGQVSFSPFTELELEKGEGAGFVVSVLNSSDVFTSVGWINPSELAARELIEKEREIFKDDYGEAKFKITDENLNGLPVVKEEISKLIMDGKEGSVVDYYINNGNRKFVIGYAGSVQEVNNNLATFNQMLSTFKFIEDETADWNTYSNLWINFIFKYPSDWAIEDEYQYKSAACQFDPKCIGVRYIFLNKISDTRQPSLGEKEKFGIAINMPQCAGVKRDDLPGNNWICLFDENLETLDIYEKIKNSFQLVKDLTADWKTYRNEEYGFEINYPSALSYKEKQGGLFGIEFPEINLWLRVERKPEDFSDLKSYVTAIADAGNSKCEVDFDFPGYSACTYSVKSQNFGNKNTFAILESPNWGNAAAMGATSVEVYFENDNYFFIASYHYSSIFLSGSQEMSEDVETYNTTQRYNTIQQMLSTFRFLD